MGDICREQKKILIVVNLFSGSKNKFAILNRLYNSLDKGQFFIRTVIPGSKEDVLRQVRDSDSDIIVAIGGDGTVNLVAQGVLGSSKVLCIIPCGSGNGLAYHLGIPARVQRAINLIKTGVVESIDYGIVNDVPFFCTSGVGLDAKVAQAFANQKKRGLNGYVRIGWRLMKQMNSSRYTITIDSDVFELDALEITVGNANQWGNYAKITPLASVKDGLLDVMVLLPCKAHDIPALAVKIMDGRIHFSHHAIMFRGHHVTIERLQQGPVHCDGDAFDMGRILRFNTVPSSLRVIVPKGRHL